MRKFIFANVLGYRESLFQRNVKCWSPANVYICKTFTFIILESVSVQKLTEPQQFLLFKVCVYRVDKKT